MIFWKYIKGLNQTSEKRSLYTWINFAPEYAQTGDLNRKENSPTLYVCHTQDGTWKDCGYLMASKMQGQYFDYVVGFSEGTYQDIIKDNSSSHNIYFERYLNGTSNQLYIGRSHSDTNYPYQVFIGGSNSDNWLANTWVVGTALYVGSDTSRTSRWVKGYITAVNIYANDFLGTGGNCEVTGYVKASYFNATSDRRAKTDIQPLLIDALDLVRKTQLYSFKYKETDTPSIGIIAQDVQDININGFKLVDNEEATGKDLDYMTIHESKLTYILWKAVQEQQKLIEDLQKEIKALKKN